MWVDKLRGSKARAEFAIVRPATPEYFTITFDDGSTLSVCVEAPHPEGCDNEVDAANKIQDKAAVVVYNGLKCLLYAMAGEVRLDVDIGPGGAILDVACS